MLWNLITDFGDSAAMLPAAGLLLAWLAATGQSRAAAVWAGLFVGQACLVAATKIAFRGWGLGIESVDFTGISGHAALACSVVPIGLHLATRRAGPWLGAVATGIGFAAGVVVGVSRVALFQHSWSEVVAGCALGSGVALAFMALLGGDRSRATAIRAPVLAGLTLGVVLLMHGVHAPSERLITRIALHLSGHDYAYVRHYVGDGWSRRTLRAAATPLLIARRPT